MRSAKANIQFNGYNSNVAQNKNNIQQRTGNNQHWTTYIKVQVTHNTYIATYQHGRNDMSDTNYY